MSVLGSPFEALGYSRPPDLPSTQTAFLTSFPQSPPGCSPVIGGTMLLGCGDQWNGTFSKADCLCLPLHCLLSRDPKQPPPHSWSGGCILKWSKSTSRHLHSPAPVVKSWPVRGVFWRDEGVATPVLDVTAVLGGNWVPEFRWLIWPKCIKEFWLGGVYLGQSRFWAFCPPSLWF